MNKKSSTILLAVFGNALIFAIGFIAAIFFPFYMYSLVSLAVMAAILAVHVIASLRSWRRFERKYGISAGRYILYGALPAAAFDIIQISAVFFLMTPLYEVFGDLTAAIFLIAESMAGYSTIYIIILAAVLRHYSEKTDKEKQ